ncbi:MAG: HoxN/HupN/NixA family nickel/cobalt transporter, partial [Elusimicrobia bacterium]|nr:HoxN/HupN/NixA family nickel/cobalt transporter [Elusimicrobiota bacterium]
MLSKLIGVFDDSPADVRGAILGLYALLAAGNLLVWALALRAFHGFPALMGTAVLAYCLGLRHAVDADHIAAIDNVTRKLMQAGKRPVSTGFYFSLGHSTVVFLASLAIAAGAAGLESRFPRLQAVGGVVGTCVSAGFMLLIAFLNIAILRDLHRAFKNVREGGAEESGALEELLKRRGLLGRFFRGAYGLIGRAWHMYPLGFLFGLGFDTATEIGLLGITALEAAKGLPAWSILLFPALFAAGMCLVDA